MGYLNCSGIEYQFEDRLLAHLKSAIVKKLRKKESFLLSWAKEIEEGGGRVSVWISPHSALAFRFSGSRPPALNKAWLSVLAAQANTPRGLVVLTEKEAETLVKQGVV